MRKGMIVVVIMMVASALAAWFAMGGGAKRGHSADTASGVDPAPGHFGCTDATRLVHLEVPGRSGMRLPLSVPADYLGYSRNWEGGEQRLVRIYAEFPSMRAFPTGTLWHSCTGDTVRKGADPTEWPADKLMIEFGSGGERFDESSEDYVEVPSEVADLRHVQNRCMAETAQNGDQCRYVFWYFPNEERPDWPKSIACTGAVQNRSASCEASMTYRGVPMSFSFKRSRLGEWQQIGKGVSDLLSSFAQTPDR